MVNSPILPFLRPVKALRIQQQTRREVALHSRVRNSSYIMLAVAPIYDQDRGEPTVHLSKKENLGDAVLGDAFAAYPRMVSVPISVHGHFLAEPRQTS